MSQRSDEAEFLTTLRDASIRTAVQYLRVIQRLRDALGGGTGPDDAATPPAPPGDFLFDVARLQLHGYQSLLDLTDRYADHFISALRARGRRRTRGGEGERRCLRLSAALQSPATGELDVTNDTGAAGEVQLVVSRARPADGRGGVEVPATFLPERVRLAAGETRSIRLVVFLDGRFEAGVRYFAEIEIGMRGRVVERLPLEITVLPAVR